MNKRLFRLLYSFFFITYFFYFLQGCKEDTAITPTNHALNYVSNDVGKWIIYDCDSIVHLDNDNNTDNNVDTSHFQIKEIIDSLGVDGENQTIQHLSRYKRTSDSVPWTFLERWTAKITQTGYQKVEDNIRYLKLGFPISSATTWNGNAFNNLGEEDYYYGSVNQSDLYNSFRFDSTLMVVQGDSTIGFQNYPFGIEKYATGVGMYFHYYADVDYYPATTFIITGVQYYERINSYGHN